jgi:ankyrin repeat protein
MLEEYDIYDVSSTPAEVDLFEACVTHDVAQVRKLLADGADINLRDDYGITPLMYACQVENTELCRVLLENGADLQAEDSEFGETEIMRAASNGIAPLCSLLLEFGAKIDEGDRVDDRSPLARAVMQGHLDCVKLLCEKGANPDSMSRSLNTPLLWAALFGHADICKYLILEGHCETRVTDSDGLAALQIATSAGHATTVKVLQGLGLPHGDENIRLSPTKSKENKTPLRVGSKP